VLAGCRSLSAQQWFCCLTRWVGHYHVCATDCERRSPGHVCADCLYAWISSCLQLVPALSSRCLRLVPAMSDNILFQLAV
jgi:hypothetical protein